MVVSSSSYLQVLRLLKTSVPQQSTKTPIQEWGWDYLLRQRALKRPISPHLTVYKPQVTWMVSGFHRMTGCAMAGECFFCECWIMNSKNIVRWKWGIEKLVRMIEIYGTVLNFDQQEYGWILEMECWKISKNNWNLSS